MELSFQTSIIDSLYVQTSNYLLNFDLKNYNFDLGKTASPPKPTILQKYPDEEKGLPTCMGVLKSNQGALSNRMPPLFVGGMGSKSIYFYDAYRNRFEKSELKFNEVKDSPIVEEIGDKVYVLQPCKVFESYNPTYLTFGVIESAIPSRLTSDISLEIFNPFSPNSECLLAQPPPKFWSHFVFRQKLYVVTFEGREILRFEPSVGWVNDFSILKYCYRTMNGVKVLPNHLIPHGGKMLSPNILIALQKFTVDHHLNVNYIPYVYLFSKDGILIAYQQLPDIFGGMSVHETYCFVDGDTLIALGVGIHPHPCFSKPLEGGHYDFPYEVFVVSIVKLSMVSPIARLATELQDVIEAGGQLQEHQFIRPRIEKQYFFNAQDLVVPCIFGAFVG